MKFDPTGAFEIPNVNPITSLAVEELHDLFHISGTFLFFFRNGVMKRTC